MVPDFLRSLAQDISSHGFIAVIAGVAIAMFGRLVFRVLFGMLFVAAEKLERRADLPIMKERINSGSDKFFEREEKTSQASQLRQGLVSFGEPDLPDVPDELELVRNLWPKSVHQSRKRARLPDVRKPADPGDGALEPEPESRVNEGPVLP
jgi:hypothetical protein